jgi:hypothetical protein
MYNKYLIPKPHKIIIPAYIFLVGVVLTFYSFDFYSEYFKWGPPVKIFGKIIVSQLEFYVFLFIFFFNEIIIALLDEIVYPWVVNCVQDPKSVDMYYSPKTALRLVVLNSIYSSLNLLFIITGSFSQISFFAASLCGSTLVVYITNKRYIKNRMYGYSGFDSPPGSEKQILLPLH